MSVMASQITCVNRLFMRRSKKSSKLRVTGICEGNPPTTFRSQRASNAEKVSIKWRNHAQIYETLNVPLGSIITEMQVQLHTTLIPYFMGLLPDTWNCGLRMRRECSEPHQCGLAIPTCIMARVWRTCRDACRDRRWRGERWRGKRSRHSKRMRNPQFYVSGTRPMASDFCKICWPGAVNASTAPRMRLLGHVNMIVTLKSVQNGHRFAKIAMNFIPYDLLHFLSNISEICSQ